MAKESIDSSMVLNRLCFLRGVCIGLVLPGIWSFVRVLGGSELDLAFNVAVLGSVNVLAKMLFYWKFEWCFSKKVIGGLGVLGMAGGLLHSTCLTLGIAELHTCCYVLLGLWSGALDKIEGVFVDSVFQKPNITKALEAKQIAKVLGNSSGAVLGFVVTYFRVGVWVFEIPEMTVGLLVFFVALVAAVDFCLSFPKVPKKVRRRILTGRRKDHGESWKYETASISLSRPQEEDIEVPHLAMFTVMLLALIFYLSYPLKEVAFLVLFMKSNYLTTCKVGLEVELFGIYVGFLAMKLLESLGTYLTHKLKGIDNRVLTLFIVIALGIGQGLMIQTKSISLGEFALAMGVQSLTLPAGIAFTGNLLFSVLGSEPPLYFTMIYMCLEVLGNFIGPFWTVQAYQVKCSLCFTFILIFLISSFFLLALSWKQAEFQKTQKFRPQENLALNLLNEDYRYKLKRNLF